MSAPPVGRLAAHVRIARPDHWFKQVFCLPGVVLAAALLDLDTGGDTVADLVLAFVGVSLVASSNYVVNELVDAPTDAHHPHKAARPAVAGLVHRGLAWLQWPVFGAAGVAVSAAVSAELAATAATLWVMGVVYNVRPVRSKDVPVVDVLSESVNNPLRLMAGWYAVGGTGWPPLSLLVGYWLVGGFLMAAKRSAEFRTLGDRAADYRRSFTWYTARRLDALMVFCLASASLLGGVFIALHRLELVLLAPVLALVVAAYWALALRPDSPVQAPEGLWREGRLMALCLLAAVGLVVLALVDLPWLADLFDVDASG